MTELTLLLPELRRVAAFAAVRLWVARGDRLPDIARGREAALRSAFEFLGAGLPAAALSRSLDSNDGKASDVAGALWLRADPCHVMADAAAVRLLAWDNLGLTPEESAEFARALRPLFGDAGFPLEPATPQRWYLRCPPEAKLPTFAPPQAVLGADLLPHLPQGANERQWRHLLNEAQVILHNHPLNQRRAQRGQVTANSVWFWGAGTLPAWVRTPFACVYSNDETVRALVAIARCMLRPVEAFAAARGSESLLLDLATTPELSGPLALVERALRGGNVAALTLRFESGEGILFRRRHRWRVWRRVRAA